MNYWDLIAATGRELQLLQSTDINDANSSPLRQFVPLPGDYTQHQNQVTQNYHVRLVLFSPDGQMVAVGAGNLILLFRTDAVSNDFQLVHALEGHSKQVIAATFNPTGDQLLTLGLDRRVNWYSVEAGRQTNSILKSHLCDLISGCFSPNVFMPSTSHACGGAVAMGMHDGTVLIWNLGDGTDQLKLRGHSSEVWAVTFNSLTEAAGEVLFASGGNDGFVCIWGLGKHSTTMATVGTLRHRLDSHRLSISCLSFCYCDAVRLVSGSRDGTAVVWDVVAGTKLRQLDLEARTGQRKTPVTAVSFSNEGTFIGCGYARGAVAVWDPSSADDEHLLVGLIQCREDISALAYKHSSVILM
jgi:WD40 repeat protein